MLLNLEVSSIHINAPFFLNLQGHRNRALALNTPQKMKFSIKDFLSKCDQISIFQRIWSHLLKKPLTENLIFYAVKWVKFLVPGIY